MKILIVQDKFGVLSEVFLYRMTVGLKNVDVDVLTGEYLNQDLFPYRNVFIWDKKVNFFSRLYLLLKRKFFSHIGISSGEFINIINNINKSDVDLVCFQFSFLPVGMGEGINTIKKKICIIHHGTDVNKAIEDKNYHRRLKVIWKRVDKIIFVSKFLKNVGLELGCPDDKSIVNYLGVPCFSGFKRINDNIFRFILVARMIPVKNHKNILRAFAQVVESSKSAVELIFIGDGVLKKDIFNEITSLGLKQYVALLGALSNKSVIKEISNSDCILMVSKVHSLKGIINQQEGLGISLLEGASLGLPMIGSTTGGIPEIVIDNTNGYLVDPLDIVDIKKAMLKVIECPELSKSMGSKAKLMVHEKFNINKQIQKFENIFIDICTKI